MFIEVSLEELQLAGAKKLKKKCSEWRKLVHRCHSDDISGIKSETIQSKY